MLLSVLEQIGAYPLHIPYACITMLYLVVAHLLRMYGLMELNTVGLNGLSDPKLLIISVLVHNLGTTIAG